MRSHAQPSCYDRQHYGQKTPSKPIPRKLAESKSLEREWPPLSQEEGYCCPRKSGQPSQRIRPAGRSLPSVLIRELGRRSRTKAITNPCAPDMQGVCKSPASDPYQNRIPPQITGTAPASNCRWIIIPNPPEQPRVEPAIVLVQLLDTAGYVRRSL